jgi:type II secretory pathway predicted ATPase ExeA
MSRSQFESPPPSSLSSVAETARFHNNLHYQEVLATLRYGIIARKGLILLMGDPGVGKSTVLHQLTHQLTREPDTNVTCIFESDPEVNFTDLLRLVLGNLEVPNNSRNNLSMMQRCKVVLRSQLEQGRIISLMIDNAERLRDESLEYLLHYFYSAAPAGGDENLLQIVLAGRPELREKLAQPRLRSLKPRSGVVCQLKPLRDKDIAAYLKTRLRAAHLVEETFDSAAIDRIAAYTGGNPHLINAISNRALQVSEQSSATNVTAEMVARAAHGLDLSARRPPGETTKQNVEIPNESEEPFRSVDGDTTEVVGQTFLNYTFDDPKPSLWTAHRARNVARLVLILLLLGGTAAWLQSKSGKTQLAKWLGAQSGSSGVQQRPQSEANAPVIARQDVPAKPAPPGGESSSPSISESTIDSSPLADAEKSVEIPSPIQTEKGTGETSPPNDPKPARDPKPPRKALPPTSNEPQALVQDAGAQRKLLEAKIYKAIENRAITGVNVAVINGTAVLEGRVATERQKNAAERAARSVSGVDRVRNKISVSSG